MYFSTRMASGTERKDRWIDAVKTVAGPFQFDFKGRDFIGSVEHRKLARLDCVRIKQTTNDAIRTRRDLDYIEDCFFIFLQLAGELKVSQGGNETVLKAGEMTIVESRRTSEFRMSGNNSLLCLHIDPARLDFPHSDISSRVATRLCGTSASILQAMMITGFEAAACGTTGQDEAIEAAILTILSATLRGDIALQRADAEPLDPLLAAIREVTISRLRDPSLSPAFVASELNVTERQVHRALQSTGLSLCRWIRQSRLERCAAVLRDDASGSKSITEIALEWGFNDVAHFSRSFRAEFGQSPREYRQQ